MSKDSYAFLNEVNLLIENQTFRFTNVISGKVEGKIPLLRLSDEETHLIKKIFLMPNHAEVLNKFMLAFGREIVFSLLCIIDGVSDTENDLPDISLVNRETKKEINSDFLHDEFIDLLES